MKRIEIRNSQKTVLVSDEDFNHLIQHRWLVTRASGLPVVVAADPARTPMYIMVAQLAGRELIDAPASPFDCSRESLFAAARPKISVNAIGRKAGLKRHYQDVFHSLAVHWRDNIDEKIANVRRNQPAWFT